MVPATSKCRLVMFFDIAMRRDVVARALKVAAIVGTILVAINHGGALLAGEFAAERWLQVVLTYFVPYGVSTYSSVAALKENSS